MDASTAIDGGGGASKGGPGPPGDRTLVFDLVLTQLLTDGCRARFRAHGGSMYPTVKDGELVTVEAARPREVAVGDIVLYRSARGVIAHRLVAVTGAGSSTRYVCRGDSARQPDAPIHPDTVVGRIVEIERAGSVSALGRGGGRWRVIKHIKVPRVLSRAVVRTLAPAVAVCRRVLVGRRRRRGVSADDAVAPQHRWRRGDQRSLWPGRKSQVG